MGFSGFEGRHYSQFDSLEHDLAGAADLQMLINALAFKYLAEGSLNRNVIPDSPSLESERRQIFFASAIGVPTFFVRKDTENRFLARIISKTREVRGSSRYPGYLRVKVSQYRLALLEVLQEDAGQLIEMMGLSETIADLRRRLCEPERFSAEGKLTRGILEEVNAKSPMKAKADDFNRGAERYYRGALRRSHMEEGVRFLRQDFRELDSCAAAGDAQLRSALYELGVPAGARAFLDTVSADLLADRLEGEGLRRLMNLTLLSIVHDAGTVTDAKEGDTDAVHAAPVYRAG
jgi:hypothetical protein